MLKWDSPLLNSLPFDVALHFGSLLALILYFHDDLWDLIRSWFQPVDSPIRRENRRLGILLAAATVPGALAGAFFEKQAATSFRDPSKIAIALLAAGIVMVFFDLWRDQRRDLSGLRFWRALGAGIFQAFAIFPGVSRSGATLSALRLFGFRRPDAARISFLLALPLLAGASLLEGRHLLKGIPSGDLAPVAAGVVVSALTGYFTIKFFMKYLRSHSLLGFGLYRMVLAATVLALVALRA
jgi:undecaprenyl-diphosphatase